MFSAFFALFIVVFYLTALSFSLVLLQSHRLYSFLCSEVAWFYSIFGDKSIMCPLSSIYAIMTFHSCLSLFAVSVFVTHLTFSHFVSPSNYFSRFFPATFYFNHSSCHKMFLSSHHMASCLAFTFSIYEWSFCISLP